MQNTTKNSTLRRTLAAALVLTAFAASPALAATETTNPMDRGTVVVVETPDADRTLSAAGESAEASIEVHCPRDSGAQSSIASDTPTRIFLPPMHPYLPPIVFFIPPMIP